MSQVLLTTPLVSLLSKYYPKAQLDWAISDWARAAIATNERISQLISTGNVGLPSCSWAELLDFGRKLRKYEYDTCFIPSGSALLSLVAWMANIPQRVGLDVNGRGVAHTLAVQPQVKGQHTAEGYLDLARALGISPNGETTEFFPTNRSRTEMSERLVAQVGWLGDVPLAILHPGGGENPKQANATIRWPVERFARLGNYLAREFEAKVVIVGTEHDRPHAAAVAGLMSAAVYNLAGETNLSELGALCEMANLYVGNDAGPTHIAAAVGCPTIAIFGPTDPTFSRPYTSNARVRTLWRPFEGKFTWENGVSTEKVREAAAEML